MPDQPWSYSALNSYETCPKKHWHLNVKKDVKEPPSEHLTHGNRVHTAFEKRVKEGKPLPIGMRQHEPMLNALANLPGVVEAEQKLAINENFGPCEWFGKTVWARCIIDYLNIQGPKALVIDWKTGKRREDDDQLALMAAIIFCHMEEVQEVHSSFYWMQEPEGQQLDTYVVRRDKLPVIFNRFLPRIKVYQNAFRLTEFPARPGGLCRKHCPVKSCPHNGG